MVVVEHGTKCYLDGMKSFHIWFLLLVAFLCAPEIHSQEIAERYVCVTLNSGVTHCGTILADDGREITLNTPNLGRLVLPKINVVRIDDSTEGTVKETLPSEFSDRHVDDERALQATRYFFAPSAFPLKKDEGYGSFSLITGGNLSYGLSESTIAGFSASWLGLGLNIKQSFQLSDNLWASIGGLWQISYRGSSGARGSGTIHFPFVNVTKGDENNQLTLGFGYLGGTRTVDESSFLSPAELVERRLSSPMINLSGSVQIAPKAWLISENYYFFSPEFFEVNQVGSLGIRTWNERRNRLNEYAIMFLAMEEGGLQPVPWLSWTWAF